jgi:DNA mismatch repair protein MutS2
MPLSAELDATTRVLLITGPNAGGKTVALKTVGLLTAMHEAGLPIPAEAGSAIPPTGGVWADIGDDQSIAQSLSTFSGHLTSILRILASARSGDLVLLDEAGAGTDPAEGAALAAAIIDALRIRGVRLLATSHYAELKQYAQVTAGVVNGAVEFDVGTLRPTYRLIVGTPGGSQAFAIAQRLGLPAELLEAAKARRSDQGAALDASLAAAAAARTAAEDASRVAAALLQRAEDELRQAVAARKEGEAARADAIASATADARAAAADLIARVGALKERIERSGLTGEVQEAIGALHEAVAAAEPVGAAGSGESGEQGSLDVHVQAGDRVSLRSGAQGEVISSDGRTVLVALGAMRASISIGDVIRVVRPASGEGVSVRRPPAHPLTHATLDVRGARVDEAISVIEQRIDDLLLAGGERLEIIHGVGTGALRDAIRRRLRELPEVRDVLDAERPGRDGVTVAVL